MTSVNSSNDPYHHHHHLHKAGSSSRNAAAGKDAGRSLPATLEASSSQPSTRTLHVPRHGFDEERLSETMFEDELDPFARAPISVEHKNESVVRLCVVYLHVVSRNIKGLIMFLI